MKVLIVDDSRFAQKTLHKFLKDMLADAEFIFARDGQQGLESYRIAKPDVIVTDLLMPKMSGQKMITAIREIDTGIPIIVITANIQQAVKENMEAMGIAGFVTKPLTDDKIPVVRALLQKVII